MPTTDSDLEHLSILGKEALPSKTLEAFPNRSPQRFYLVRLETDEFTCICPVTKQPDFATIIVEYIPDKMILESKSYKLYIWSYRDEGVFHEHVVNTMLEDLIRAVDPHYCKVTGIFNVRGGVGITVEAEELKTPEAKSAVYG